MDETRIYRIRRAGPAGDTPADRVTLDYAGRFLRRKRLVSDAGNALMVDLPETMSLNAGDTLVAEDGIEIAVAAATEPLIEVRAPGPVLARLAWHIGNRHTPAQIEAERLLIQADRVMEDMLARLGAATRAVTEPFTPEGGAYGTGRTHSHHHGPAEG